MLWSTVAKLPLMQNRPPKAPLKLFAWLLIPLKSNLGAGQLPVLCFESDGRVAVEAGCGRIREIDVTYDFYQPQEPYPAGLSEIWLHSAGIVQVYGQFDVSNFDA